MKSQLQLSIFFISMLPKYNKTRRYSTLQVPTSSSCGGLVAFGCLDPTPLDLQPSSKLHTLSLQTQCLDTMSGHNVWTQCLDTMAGHNGAMWQCGNAQYSTVHYSTVQCSTVQYSTVQYSTVQYSTVQYSTVQYSTVQYSTVQYNRPRHYAPTSSSDNAYGVIA